MDSISFPVRRLVSGAARVLADSSGPTCSPSVPDPSELVPEEEDVVLEESLLWASHGEVGEGCAPFGCPRWEVGVLARERPRGGALDEVAPGEREEEESVREAMTVTRERRLGARADEGDNGGEDGDRDDGGGTGDGEHEETWDE